uniref:Uncharacterized protein n=1 Tax=Ananas comosus var. bracteatus TaxID=296719 RepID=A0A6V7QCR2_ANACO|nr:unnamed protein product [Ananas comosus var. bracteatus]
MKDLDCSQVELCEAVYRYCIARVPVLELVPVLHHESISMQCIFSLTRGSGLRVLLPGTGTPAGVTRTQYRCRLHILVMSTTRSTAAEVTEPEKPASLQSGKIRKLREQLATLVGVVERQSSVALLQAEALRRQDEGIRRLENLLIQ